MNCLMCNTFAVFKFKVSTKNSPGIALLCLEDTVLVLVLLLTEEYKKKHRTVAVSKFGRHTTSSPSIPSPGA